MARILRGTVSCLLAPVLAVAATFRADNRLVLTYLPEGRPADSDAIDADADRAVEESGEEVAA